jgi:hypothetical protein
MDWKQYETEIHSHFRQQYTDAEITLDANKIGLYSKVSRQIDILIEQYVAGNRFTLVIDGKYFNKKVDVKAVESFIGMLEDLGAHKGLLISNQGFSEAAYNRAHFGPSEVELDILNFDDLHKFQDHGAIPYSDENMALVQAPFGWVIEAQGLPLSLAALYQQGLTIDEAMDRNEFMYIQFWDRKATGDNLDDLLEIQLTRFKEKDSHSKVEYLPTIRREGSRTILRKATIKNYPSSEFTGFIEFTDFIFLCVMFTPENRERQNIRKLENILELVKAGKVKHQKDTEIVKEG